MVIGTPNRDGRPIVVGGCYRSGTSLVRRVLDAHPRIHCGPEVKFFRDFYGDYIGVEDPIERLRFMVTARSLLSEGEVLRILGAAFVEMHERAAGEAGKARWADKVPENMAFLEQWQELLGDNWLLLHVVRNPLDTLASIKEWEFPRSIPVSLEDRIALYVRYAEAGLDFAAANPGRYVRLFYEDLVARPEPTVRELMSRLGEELDPAQLEPNAAPHQPGLEDPKAGKAAAIHTDSVGGWRRMLTATEAERISTATTDVWLRLGGEAMELPGSS
jgi:hypothetical protein